ncbi:hypothetical protein M8A51_17545 [Schlegelella sp. S2-27]|uniref:Asl1-like glycosyl hydrolase catalytic domain-containing protein n=1 Tax=Caldimonas mangrovi TaxID=2944811 RepID=A0ABT0YSN3_9BURK|nr:hypothetical protein [Caldimonas mangrovi]
MPAEESPEMMEAGAATPGALHMGPEEGAATESAMALSTTSADDPTLVTSSDFEGTYTGRAPGWSVNYWGAVKFAVSRETTSSNVYAGNSSQRFRITSRPAGSEAHLIRSYGFENGKTYRMAVYLKASAATTATVQMRYDLKPYTVFASKKVNLTTGWQRVEIEGAYDFAGGGSIRLQVGSTNVDVYVDNMTLREVLPTASDASDGIVLPAAGGSATQIVSLASSNLEGTYASTAPGWRVNYWGTPTPSWAVSRETRGEHVHSGSSSQLYRVNSIGNGDVHLTYPFGFKKGKKYRATMWIKSSVNATVQVFMRRDIHPWDPFATKTVAVTPTWQKVEITGTYLADVGGTLRVSPKTMGATVWIDDMTISEVVENSMAPANTDAIPSTLFGVHINKFGTHQQWPGLGHGVVRLWNTGTTWRELEPSNGVWNFTTSTAGRRLDMLVDYVKKNDPSANILYTLGQTPQWASKTPGISGLYGVGASGAPANMADWRDYVRTLARRYAGRIRYWELWNEPDYGPHYNGSVSEMIEMARIAQEELKAADPANKLVSPGVTAGQGMPWLNNFLAAGGGSHVDIIGFHWYFDTSPEKLGPAIDNVRQLMATYGVADKELWNTEGAPGCDALIYTCSAFVPSIEQKRSTTARALMMMWAKGVSNQNYYFWERTEALSKLVESDYRTPTAAAVAYKEIATWMKGARMVDAYRVNDKVYVFRMNRGTENYVIMWSTAGGTVVNLPSSWSVYKTRSLSGTEASIPSSRQLTIGIEPVMLKP